MYNLLRAYACAREKEKEKMEGGKEREREKDEHVYATIVDNLLLRRWTRSASGFPHDQSSSVELRCS